MITLGGGDGLCSRVYRVKGGNFELLHRMNSYHSIGNYYSYITKICGFTAHKHEGEITGLAAYGQPHYKALLLSMIRYDQGNIQNRGNCYYWAAVEKIQKALPRIFELKIWLRVSNKSLKKWQRVYDKKGAHAARRFFQ